MTSVDAALRRWPPGGVIRVHPAPGELPKLGDAPGANRFDDPRPRTPDRFLMRYAATTIRGCLLEVLAAFRPSPEADLREADVDVNDPDHVPPPDFEAWQPIADFLAHRKVAHLSVDRPIVVSINDPYVQQELDSEPGVRALLDTRAARALLGTGDHAVHLDNAAVRLSGALGRYLTQACALALYDRETPPHVIHYRSRHDDAEHCWAIFHHAEVSVGEPSALSPAVDEHLHAVRSVARLWSLALPPRWR